MTPSIHPKKWHIYIVDLEPQVKSKPGKQRPCLAIQPSKLSELGLTSTVVFPITSKLTPNDAYPLRVRFPKGVCTLKVDSDVMIDQILAWDNSFFKKDLGEIPEFYQKKITKALVDFLDWD